MPQLANDSGGVDIAQAGDHDPVHARTAGDIKAETNSRVNQNRRGPDPGAGAAAATPAAKKGGESGSGDQSKGQDNPVGGFFSGLGSGLSKLWNESPSQVAGKNPFAPVDWAKHYGEDAGMVWNVGRKTYGALTGFFDPDSGPYHTSIHNYWEQDDAGHRFSQILASSLTQSVPLAQLPQLPAEAGLAKDELTGNVKEEDARARERKIQEQNVEQLPAGLAGTATLGLAPESAIGRAAAFAGLPAAQAGLEGQPLLPGSLSPDDMSRTVAWAAVTGMILGGGHIPQGMRDQLGKAFGKWPEVEQFVKGMLTANKQGAKNAANPQSSHKTDYIEQVLAKGGFEGTEPILAAARKGPQEVTMIKDAEGNFIQKRDAQKEKSLKALKKFGVDKVSDIVHDAENGRVTGKYADAVIKHWKNLGFGHDLSAFYAPDDPLRNPGIALQEIQASGNQELKDLGLAHMQSIQHVLHQVHSGVHSAGGNPWQATVRSLAGLHRGTDLAVQHYVKTGATMLADTGVQPRKLVKAVEDRATYDSLPAEARLWVDGWRTVSNGLRQQAKDTRLSKHFVGNYFPRMEMLGEDAIKGGAGSPFRSPGRKHRATQIQRDPASGQLYGTPQYESLEQAAFARKGAREDFLARISDPLKDIPKTFRDDPEMKRLRDMLGSNPDEAKQGLEKLAKQAYPDLELNPLKTLNRYLHQHISAIHSHQALQELENAHMKPDKNGEAGTAAVPINPQNEHLMDVLKARGYKPIEGNWRLQDYLFHPEAKKFLEDYVGHANSKVRNAAWFQKLLGLEGNSLGLIMMTPQIHAWNMAARMGMAQMMHPLEMAHYIKNGKAMTPHQMDEESFRLRQEAINGGFIPHKGGKGWMDNMSNVLNDSLGDTGTHVMEEAKTGGGRLASLVRGPMQFKDASNDYFWRQVNDFGTMMFHLEKIAALKHGRTEEQATIWAGRRASSWAGTVAPEDTNPLIHDMARAVFFAPNWWRTWAELLVPIYRRSGMEMSPGYARMLIWHGAKTIAAMVALQKLTGEALNYAGSGHFQNENLPGRQDNIELTAPWLDQIPGVTALAGPANNPKTGGRRYLENPLGRTAKDFEGAAGLQSGHTDYKPEDVYDGISRFVTSRLSPVVFGAGAMMNMDLYRTAQDHQFRAVNPEVGFGRPDWLSPLYAAIYLSPLGSQLADQIAKADAQGSSELPLEMQMPFGTKLPKSWDPIVKSMEGSLGKTLWAWATGVNAPYQSAERSRGQAPSDDAYMTAQKYQTEYHDQMAQLSAKSMGGEITPNQWLNGYTDAQGVTHTGYKELSKRHHDRLGAIYHDDPHYVNGGDGLLNEYEGLYDQATTPDGGIDYHKLNQLQHEFRDKHPKEGLASMDEQLSKNDQKYPMLKLYHKTMSSYAQWQEKWANDNGVDVGQLRQQISEYGGLYGQSVESRQYIAHNRDLARYEQAKKREWEQSPAGLMYGMFYNSSTVSRYMRAHHMTAQDVEAGAQQ